MNKIISKYVVVSFAFTNRYYCVHKQLTKVSCHFTFIISSRKNDCHHPRHKTMMRIMSIIKSRVHDCQEIPVLPVDEIFLSIFIDGKINDFREEESAEDSSCTFCRLFLYMQEYFKA